MENVWIKKTTWVIPKMLAKYFKTTLGSNQPTNHSRPPLETLKIIYSKTKKFRFSRFLALRPFSTFKGSAAKIQITDAKFSYLLSFFFVLLKFFEAAYFFSFIQFLNQCAVKWPSESLVESVGHRNGCNYYGF